MSANLFVKVKCGDVELVGDLDDFLKLNEELRADENAIIGTLLRGEVYRCGGDAAPAIEILWLDYDSGIRLTPQGRQAIAGAAP